MFNAYVYTIEFLSQFGDDEKKWKLIVQELEGKKEKPLRFLHNFIMGNYEVEEITEDRIYDWFTRNEKSCGYVRDPFGFVNHLIDNVNAYESLRIRRKSGRGSNRYLSNLRMLSGSARQHLILLLAARRLPAKLLEKLARQIENLPATKSG